MTDAAPERITLARKIGATEWQTMPKGHTMSMGYIDAERYVPEADLLAAQDIALERGEKLFAAQARIAELEAALRPFAKSGELFDGYEGTCLIYDPAKGREWGINSDDLKAARRALEAKP